MKVVRIIGDKQISAEELNSMNIVNDILLGIMASVKKRLNINLKENTDQDRDKAIAFHN